MNSGRARFGVLVSGLRWRAGTALATLVLSVVAVGIGAFGPIYLGGTDQAVLSATLEGAPPGDAGLTLQPAQRRGSLGQLLRVERRLPRSSSGTAWFGPPIATEEAGATAVMDGQPYLTDVAARSDVCAHLTMLSGTCRMARGAVVMSRRSAQQLHLGLGQSLDLAFIGSSRSAVLTITGLYAPAGASDPYWWGANYFGYGAGSVGKPELDDVFTSFAGFPGATPAPYVSPMLQVPLRPGAITVDDVGSFQASLDAFAHGPARHQDVRVSSQVVSLLGRAGAQEHTTGSVIAVVDLELFLLAVFVLYYVASRTAAVRAPDVRLAELRGFPPRSTMAVALAEPVALVAVAIPVGLLLAWLVADAGASAFFGSGVEAPLPALAVAAAVVSGVAGMVAVGLASRRLIGSDVGTPVAASPGSKALRTTVETAVVAVAAAAVVELSLAGVVGAGGSRADPLSALAPGLLALALGIVGARLLLRLLRASFGATSRSASVAWTLATRRVARQDAFIPQIVLLVLAGALTVFAVSGWAINARNRTVSDTFAVGAPTVLTVAVRPGTNFLSAVRAADPSGRWAMAAVVERASDGTTLAVDSGRMSRVMSWPPGLGAASVRQVARRLVPPGLAPPVEISGSAIALSATAAVNAQPAPELFADLFDNAFLTPVQVDLGPVVAGPFRYQASLHGQCPSGCRLVDLAVDWSPSPAPAPQAGVVDLDVSAVSEQSGARWVPVAASLGRAGGWTTSSGDASVAASPGGLLGHIELNSTGVPVQMRPADVPRLLPAMVTPTVAAFGTSFGPTLSLPGLDSGTVNARSVDEVPALPRVGDDAAMVDLQTAEGFLSGPFDDDTTEVWLSSAPPPDAFTLLAAQGLSVLSVDSVAARQHASAHGGLEQAYGLFLVAGVAAGALAVAATFLAVIVGARSRHDELTALSLVGIPDSALRRSLHAEQLVSLGAALVLGVAAGLLSARFALVSVPEAVGGGPGPPLELGLPWPVVTAVAGGLVVALWLTVWRASALAIGSTVGKRTGRRR